MTATLDAVTETAPAKPRSVAWLRAAPAFLPAVLIAISGWSYRWMNEDAFINLRIVDQIFAGNGPVFNAGERVEAATSPLWLAVIVVGRALFGWLGSIEWITLLLSLAAAVAAFLVAGVATRMLHRDEPGVPIPIGLYLVTGVAAVWEFATSGLEMGLVWLWIATTWLVLVHAARNDTVRGTRRNLACIALGLAPLVRPELFVIMACALVAWFVLVRPRRVGLDLLAMFALPTAYQIFRMGYYASVVPTTALAKDAGGLYVHQGWEYATNFVGPYLLWLPLVLIVAVVGYERVHHPDARRAIATVALMGGAALNALYIVAIGGDYMHGRLLLPAFFAFALPASVSIERIRSLPLAAIVVGALWLGASAIAFRPPNEEKGFQFAPPTIADLRATSGAKLVPDEFTLGPSGVEASERFAKGERGYFGVADTEARAGRDPRQLVLTLGSIGVPAWHAGTDVWVVDIGGLAEPLAARSDAILGRQAGHRKQIDSAWYDARFGAADGNAKTQAARRALECGPVDDLLDAVTEPLTPGRFFSNVWRSVSFTRLKVPSDPEVAAERWCTKP